MNSQWTYDYNTFTTTIRYNELHASMLLVNKMIIFVTNVKIITLVKVHLRLANKRRISELLKIVDFLCLTYIVCTFISTVKLTLIFPLALFLILSAALCDIK